MPNFSTKNVLNAVKNWLEDNKSNFLTDIDNREIEQITISKLAIPYGYYFILVHTVGNTQTHSIGANTYKGIQSNEYPVGITIIDKAELMINDDSDFELYALDFASLCDKIVQSLYESESIGNFKIKSNTNEEANRSIRFIDNTVLNLTDDDAFEFVLAGQISFVLT